MQNQIGYWRGVPTEVLDRTFRVHMQDAVEAGTLPPGLQDRRTHILWHGPKLVQQMAPWFDGTTGLFGPRWPGHAGYANGIPVLIESEDLPGSRTVDVVPFLRTLQARLWSPENVALGACGPRIHQRPVIAATSRGKHNYCKDSYPVSQLGGQWWACLGEKDECQPLAPLDEWASTTQEAIDDYNPRLGTLYMICTRDMPQQLRAALHAAEWKQQHRGEQYPGFDEGPGEGHVRGLFIFDRDDWPSPGSDGRYTFDGRAARVYIYDPSFNVSEPARLSKYSRSTMLSKMVFAPHISFCAGAASWVAEEGRVLIGGGGNHWGLCVAMTSNWMQKTAWLYHEVLCAIGALKQEQTPDNILRWQKAEQAWDLYFRAFRVTSP